jgi:hypothetical protein
MRHILITLAGVVADGRDPEASKWRKVLAQRMAIEALDEELREAPDADLVVGIADVDDLSVAAAVAILMIRYIASMPSSTSVKCLLLAAVTSVMAFSRD